MQRKDTDWKKFEGNKMQIVAMQPLTYAVMRKFVLSRGLIPELMVKLANVQVAMLP